jgi:hypothetical protein
MMLAGGSLPDKSDISGPPRGRDVGAAGAAGAARAVTGKEPHPCDIEAKWLSGAYA